MRAEIDRSLAYTLFAGEPKVKKREEGRRNNAAEEVAKRT